MFDGNYLEWNNKRIKAIIDNYGHHFFAHKKILDLGCGHADISGVLYRLGGDVTAVDARQEHLKIVEKKYSGIKIVKADLDRGWPFFGRSFDLVLDLGLLFHLNNYQDHLKAVISSTEYLVLETAVLNSNDPHLCNVKPDTKGTYDGSANGVQTQVSAAAIERVLSECGMNFNRMDNTKLNCGSYTYDWMCTNDGTFNVNNRRLWFCQRIAKGPMPQPFRNEGDPTNLSNSNIPVTQQPLGGVTYYPAANNGANAASLTAITTSLTAAAAPPTNNAASPVTIDVPKYSYPKPHNVKVLYLPLGDQPGMVSAFREIGVELSVFDFWTTWLRVKDVNKVKKDFYTIIKNFKPHLIHMQLQFTGIFDAATLNKVREIEPKIIMTNWSGDVRKIAVPQFTSIANAVDFSLISSTGQLDMYRNAGCKNIRYWQIGFDPSFNFPMNKTSFDYDACFLGNNYGGQFPDGNLRVEASKKCQQVFGNKFGLFGSGYGGNVKGVDPKNQNSVYNNSLCVISISNFNNVSHYFSDRLLSCLGSGRPTIAWHFPGIEDYFVEGKEILVARSINDLVDKINWCKGNVELANEIGKAGYQRALKEHTFTVRVIELLQFTGLLEKK